MKTNLQDFLDVLDSDDAKPLSVDISSKKKITIKPLSFKQQKALVTSGLDGISGVMSFIKNLNDIILFNSEETDLKIFDRVPIILALRKELSSKKLTQDEVEVDVDDLITQFKKIDTIKGDVVDGNGYTVQLRIPTLKQENKLIATCIEDMKKLDIDNMGKNISTILSYEIPKFIESITFGDSVIEFDEISTSERVKIMDNLPANITNLITDYILKVRDYDEQLLTFNGTTIEIDSTFFE